MKDRLRTLAICVSLLAACTDDLDIPQPIATTDAATNTDTTLLDASQADTPKADTSVADSVLTDVQPTDTANPDTPSTDTPKADTPVADLPLPDVPLTDIANADASKPDASKPDAAPDVPKDIPVEPDVPGCLPAQCADKDPCTLDACGPDGTCTHVPSTGPCDDGNPCTTGDVCQAQVCVGSVNCACAKATGWIPPALEDCTKPGDDNCDGLINESAVCGLTTYTFSNATECGFTCYHDEAHDLTVSGDATNPSGFATYASGQLLDGIHGVDDWYADVGNGPAYEWVAWKQSTVMTFQFATLRFVPKVRLGLNNWITGVVVEPPEIQVRTSQDGLNWTVPWVFTLKAGTLPKIPDGKRGDVDLALPLPLARFVEVALVSPGSWSFVDEVGFD